MLDTMIEFTNCCRLYGLRVSTSEVLDSIRHLAIINIMDEKEFQTVIRSNYAKSRRDQSRFNSLYDLFFHGKEAVNSEDSFTHLAGTFNKIIDMVEKNGENEPIKQALSEFIRGRPAQFLADVHKLNIMAVREQKFFKSNMDQLSAKLNIMLAINQMRQNIAELIGSNFDNLDKASIKIVNHYFDKILSKAHSLLTDEPREINYSLVERKSTILSTNELRQRPFSSLSDRETKEVIEVIELFVKKLKDQASRRFRIKKRGVIDIKKTLRTSGKYQGVPLEIKFKDRMLNKSSLIVLCDISGSVWSSARFMLNVLYALQECFSKVRSFVFVAELVEVTKYFEKIGEDRLNTVNLAIETILNKNIININEHTDYGSAFSSFKKRYLNILNHKTTVIIMGDGRSNYLNPQAHILGQIRERCRRIIWLNPEPCNTWRSGDSEIFAYKSHCHEIRTCMNLNHLTEFIKELVL